MKHLIFVLSLFLLSTSVSAQLTPEQERADRLASVTANISAKRLAPGQGLLPDKMEVSENFFSAAFEWIFSPPFAGEIIGLGYESSENGARISSVTGCLFNESAFTRRFQGLLAVTQNGNIVDSGLFTADFSALTTGCTAVSLDAVVAPGEYAITVFFRYVDEDNLFAAIPGTTMGDVFDVQINNERPPITNDQSVIRGIGLAYTVDRFGTAANPALKDSGGLVLPGFLVDLTDPQRQTTFFAVRNTTDTPRDVQVQYYGDVFDGNPLRTDTITLGPQQTAARDIRSNLAGLQTVGNEARGIVVLKEAGGAADNLTGDFFRLDRANAFASGDRMAEGFSFCQDQEIRYVDFGSGTRFLMVLNQTQPDASTNIPYTAYDESGAVVAQGTYTTSSNLNVFDVSELVQGVSFGTLTFDFSGSDGGFVTGRYEALGQFSVELNSACLD